MKWWAHRGGIVEILDGLLRKLHSGELRVTAAETALEASV